MPAQGHPKAQFNLGVCYENGKGVQQAHISRSDLCGSLVVCCALCAIVLARLRVCVRVCACVCLRARARACVSRVPACARARMHS
jgi:hypothetical protein